MQMVLAKENPRLTLKVDIDYSQTEGRQFIAVMAGLWNGEVFTRYQTEYFDETQGAEAVLESVRKFRAEVENWGAE